MATYRLQAINQCLEAIGETRVNSINSGVPDAESASSMIDRVTMQVLQAGWSVNTAFDTKFYPDMDGIIRVPNTILKIDTSGRSAHIGVTVRRDVDGIDKLFKVKEQSYQFSEPVTCDVVYFFDIDGLPFALQNYIAARAARTFQASSMGSNSLDAFTQRDEEEAWEMLLDYEAEQEDGNILRDSHYMRVVTGRNNSISR